MPRNTVSHLRPAERPLGRQPEARPQFRIAVHIERDVIRVCPFGDVDIDTARRIREQLENATATGTKHVVLDLRGATFLDSTGLHIALETDAASRAQGWKFRLIGGPDHVQRVFDLTGARARLPFLTASELAVLLTAPGKPPA